MEKDLTTWVRDMYLSLIDYSDAMYAQMTERSVFGYDVRPEELRTMYEALYSLLSEVEDFADNKGVRL